MKCQVNTTMYLVQGRVTDAANPPAGRQKGAVRVRTPVGVGCCRLCAPSASARAGCGHHACGAAPPHSSCKARRQRHAGTPASSIGTPPGITEVLLCPSRSAGVVYKARPGHGETACRVQLRQQRSMSTLPIVFRDGGFPLEEKNALIFLRPSFRKGLIRELNCFLLLFHLDLKFMGRNFSWGLYTLRSFIDF